ncbi:hypothetical protein [Bacteroides faecalis]|uniref:Uncharacterized protein n=1 Tax=Bacteroides faecalis TaxID=2447885 RepID=A0A401LQ28_9BACE|nr:hypothetical protein [Bacteroides faecalis]GCB33655.1 hypothetical protein KGMB02408_06000 [Bacteroides faecalis]
MTKEIPEIDDLMKGINDSDLVLNAEAQEADHAETIAGASTSLPDGIDKCWENFLTYLETEDTRENKEDRLVCKLDRDLADSLDDCDIHNRCRSDLVNAIVRAFFEAFLPQLAKYRREKKSLFMNFKEG